MTQLRFRRKHYHHSPKAGIIYCDSSYELKAALMLDEDKEVAYYQTQIPFVVEGRDRRLDFLVTYTNGSKKVVEVKPEKRLQQFQQQIDDNRQHALSQGCDFQVWTERELGFQSDYFATKWADEYLGKLDDRDYTELRRQRHLVSVKENYRKYIATNKVSLYCEFCQCDHEVLEVNYTKNIAKNGRYICEREGGHIAGSKPKKKKENPYATEGKKECVRCHKIKTFDEFGDDKSRADGFASRCKTCRAEVAKDKYRLNFYSGISMP